MYYREKYDWETREDAETLKRYADLTSDPVRLKRAKEAISDNISKDLKALQSKPSRKIPGRSNPATIMKLNY